MILYQLKCSNEHTFEGWFRDSATYDDQAAAGDIDCPYCGDATISKAPMAPRLAKSRKSMDTNTPAPEDAARAGGSGHVPVSTLDDAMALPASDRPAGDGRAVEVAEQILKAVNMLRDYVETNYENVGEDFAEEARRIHYGETEERGIYGEATPEQSEEMAEEGIEHVRLPSPPRKNS